MATSPEVHEQLKLLQAKFAEHDPSIMDLDPNDEVDAQLIAALTLMLDAIERGESVTLSVEEDGHEDFISVHSMGVNAAGEPTSIMNIGSNDGTLHPTTVDLAVDMMGLGSLHMDEVNRLTGE
jgi:hypothetical protein